MAENHINKPTLHGGGSIIKSTSFSILIVLFLLVKVLISLVSPASGTLRASDLTKTNILQAVNQQRTLRNLNALNTNTLLTQAAQYKTDDMQARHYFAHVDPDGHYIWDKIVALGYTPYTQLGENLAIEFYDTDSLVNAWMNSPEHRANILNAGFADQGMGITLGNVQQGQYYSAIGNTFGTLAPAPKPKPTAAPKPSPTPTAPKKPSPTPTPTSVPAPVPTQIPKPLPTITPLPSQIPVTTREGGALAATTETNFALPTQEATSSSSIVIPNLRGTTATYTSPTTLAGAQTTTALTPSGYNLNRYLILVCGILLLLLILSDIRAAVDSKLGHLDKKINNFTILLISVVVIAFMYWL